MSFKEESIIGRVENVIFAGKLFISLWDIIFTNEGLIFIKMIKRNWIIIFGGIVIVVGIFVDSGPLTPILIILGFLLLLVGSTGTCLTKKKRSKMKEMSILEMFADNKDNFRLTKEELKNIRVKRGGVLVRSRVFLKKNGKKIRLSFQKKKDIDMFLSLLERIKVG